MIDVAYANIPAMHRDTARQLGPRTALRFRRNGLYHDVSWNAYRRQSDLAAAGLIELGIGPGDRVALLSENRYEWMVADQAILSTGGASVPLHAPLAPKQVEFQVGHSQSRAVIVSGQQQADKVCEVLGALPELELLISFEPLKPLPSSCSSIQMLTWNGLLHRGWQAGPDAVGELRNREQALNVDDLATIIYTSGTTGNPKGVMLTHGNLLSNAASTRAISEIDSTDVLLSWLPYSHIYARTVDLYVTAMAGATVVLADSVETLVDDLAEIKPTWLTAVPRFYEKVWTGVEHLSPDVRRAELHRIFGPRMKQLSSGGAPLPRHVCEGFICADLQLLEGYGLTETSPVISFNSLNQWRIGTVGRPIPDVEVKIDEDGEILTRGPHIMKGYWKNQQATDETIVDGWLHTGDVGHLDEDGFLTITDRKKDLIITSSGKNVAPSELERLLAEDAYIDQAVVYGDGRKFVSALIVPNFEKLDEICSELECTLETEAGFIQAPAIFEFYQQRIDSLMQAVSRPERVRKFLLLARAFQLEEDELTATLKVRRRHILQKYESQLAALYED